MFYQSPSYRASYLREIRNVDVRTLPIRKRENPPTITANKASSTGNLFLTSRGYTSQATPEKVSDGSTGKLDAVTLIRIPGTPHSTVQEEDPHRKETVKRLIQQFENHPNRDSLIQDLNKTDEFNPFSEKSKEMITSMGNTEYFELF